MAVMNIDTSDPGKAAIVVFAAAVLFARTSMMNAANAGRQNYGSALAYGDESYAAAIEDAEQTVAGVKETV